MDETLRIYLNKKINVVSSDKDYQKKIEILLKNKITNYFDFITQSQESMIELLNFKPGQEDHFYSKICNWNLPKSITAQDMLENKNKLGLGCDILNEILEGGFLTGKIFDFIKNSISKKKITFIKKK